MKKIILIFMTLLLISAVYAEEDVFSNTVDVFVDGQLMDVYDEEQGFDVPAFIYNSRTMLPLKKTFSLFGITGDQISWEGSTQTVTVRTNDNELIILQIENHTIIKGSEEVYSDVAPKVFNNRTFVPVAIISKLLGETPKWHPDTWSVEMNPSTYELDGFSLYLPRTLKYGVPTVYEDGYSIDVYEKEEQVKSLTMTLVDKKFSNYFPSVLEDQKVTSEEFSILNDQWYYRSIGRETIYYIGDFGNSAFVLTVNGFTKDEIELILEGIEVK
jgi:hypothetical protein